MIFNSYPSNRFISYVDFSIYIHQKYSKKNNDLDVLCPKCSKNMILKITNNGKIVHWECQDYLNCKSILDFELDKSQIHKLFRRPGDPKAYYGFCSCNYDRQGAIIDSTPQELLKKFISVFYWLVNIDENLYSELIEYDCIMINGNESLYDNIYKTFKFLKLYAHGAWGTHHMDPIFLFNRTMQSKRKELIRDLLPKECDLESDKNDLWNEVKEFLLLSPKTQYFRVKSLINRMEECLEKDLKIAIYKIQNFNDDNWD